MALASVQGPRFLHLDKTRRKLQPNAVQRGQSCCSCLLCREQGCLDTHFVARASYPTDAEKEVTTTGVDVQRRSIRRMHRREGRSDARYIHRQYCEIRAHISILYRHPPRTPTTKPNSGASWDGSPTTYREGTSPLTTHQHSPCAAMPQLGFVLGLAFAVVDCNATVCFLDWSCLAVVCRSCLPSFFRITS